MTTFLLSALCGLSAAFALFARDQCRRAARHAQVAETARIVAERHARAAGGRLLPYESDGDDGDEPVILPFPGTR